LLILSILLSSQLPCRHCHLNLIVDFLLCRPVLWHIDILLHEMLLLLLSVSISLVFPELVAFNALTLLVGQQEEHPAHKKYGGMVEVGTG